MDEYSDTGAETRLEFDDPEHRSGHGSSEHSGTGKLLTMFFGAAVVCAIFFGLGYKMGKSASSPDAAAVVMEEPKPVAAPTAPKPSAMAEAVSRTQQPAALETSPDARSAAEAASGKDKSSAPAMKLRPVSAPAAQSSSGRAAGNFAVQVAAVTREEDADALVGALRKKDYPVFVVGNQAGDRFFHVQVGPFSSLAEAEAMRSRLSADGYNPILKK